MWKAVALLGHAVVNRPRMINNHYNDTLDKELRNIKLMIIQIICIYLLVELPAIRIMECG